MLKVSINAKTQTFLYMKCIQYAYQIHMKNEQISARVELSPYANKVLVVLKAKYGLKDKSEAIDKFAELYGDEIVEKDANGEYVKKMIEGVDKHMKKYGHRKMSIEELDKLCGV